jgi:hypothetical protein
MASLEGTVSAELVRFSREKLRLCKVRGGETVSVFTDLCLH